jgi:hypothetical protein
MEDQEVKWQDQASANHLLQAAPQTSTLAIKSLARIIRASAATTRVDLVHQVVKHPLSFKRQTTTKI